MKLTYLFIVYMALFVSSCAATKSPAHCKSGSEYADQCQQILLKLEAKYKYLPIEGFLSKEKDAIEIGKIYLIAMYGEEIDPAHMTFSASLNGDIWTVTASHPEGEYLGGDASIRMSKSYGCVLDYEMQK